MNLYILRPILINNEDASLWTPWYDKAFGFVVSANDELQARKLASDDCGDEGHRAWLNSEHSTCKLLTAGDTAAVIMHDFCGA